MVMTVASWWILISMGASPDAALLIGTPTVESTRYTIPIRLNDGGDAVSALDFHFRYDSTVFEPVGVRAGAPAAQANKVLSANIARPGEYIVVLMGLNQERVVSGEIAYIELERIGNPSGDSAELLITQPTLASQEGAELEATGDSLSLSFSEEEPDSDAEETDQEESATEEAAAAEETEPGVGAIALASGSPESARNEKKHLPFGTQAGYNTHTNVAAGTKRLTREAAAGAKQARLKVPTLGSSARREQSPEALQDGPEQDKATVQEAPPGSSAQAESNIVENDSAGEIYSKSVMTERNAARPLTEEAPGSSQEAVKRLLLVASALILLILTAVVLRYKLFA